jgi:very-short-patch-repair endonuclease
LLRGLYAADLPVTHDVRLEAARRHLGEDAVLVGPSAAWALGAELSTPRSPVHVLTGIGTRPQQFLVPHRGRLPSSDLVSTRWGPATCPARTCIDLARGVGTARWSMDWRVAAVDAVLHATRLRAEHLRAALRRTTDVHGLGDARAVIRQARDGAESVRETLLRLLIVQHGFVEPELQVEVHDVDGTLIARLDMAWRDERAAAEYDGAVHRDDGRHSSDLVRHNRLRGRRWRVLQVDKEGLARPARFLDALGRIAPRSR